MAVTFDAQFIQQLKAIAENPIEKTKYYTKIENSHEWQMNVKVTFLVAGIALAVLAMTVLKQTKLATGAFLLGTAAVMIAFFPERVPTTRI